MAHHDDADDASISLVRSPTRRRLLSLLAGLPAADVIPGSPPARSIEDNSVCAPDTIPDLLAAFEALLARHEAAIWRCDRLEAFLLAELGTPACACRCQPTAPSATLPTSTRSSASSRRAAVVGAYKKF